MTTPVRAVAVTALAVLGLGLFLALMWTAGDASYAVPAPSASVPPSGAPTAPVVTHTPIPGGGTVQVIVPAPAQPGLGLKDMLVPLGTVLGAAAGVGGAIGAATVAARSQGQRAKQEQDYTRQQQAKLDERKRVDAVASTASSAFEKVVTASALIEAAWQQPDGTAARQAAQLAVAQVYAASELLGDAETSRLVAPYAQAANNAMAATARSRATGHLVDCAERYGSLVRHLGRWLQQANGA